MLILCIILGIICVWRSCCPNPIVVNSLASCKIPVTSSTSGKSHAVVNYLYICSLQLNGRSYSNIVLAGFNKKFLRNFLFGWFFLMVCETQFVFKGFRTLVDHKNRGLNNSRYCCMYRFKVNLGLSWPTLVQNYHLKIILHFLFSWRTNSGAYAQQVLVCNCSDWFFKISISHKL